MRTVVTRLVLSATLLVSAAPGPAAAGAARGQAARALAALVIRPAEAPEQCALRWSAAPYRLEPGPRVLETLLGGWFGTAAVEPAAVRLGISAVYTEAAGGTVTVIGLAFREEAQAVRAETLLKERYGGNAAYRYQRRGPVLTIMSAPEPTSTACSGALWEEIGRRLARA